MTSASAPRISVVLATYNRPELLVRLLEQLGRQTLAPADFEVVVVDDGSTPPVRARLAELQVRYELRVDEQTNRGAAAARHRGIVAARGEILVIVDDDMQVAEDFLEQHLRRHASGEPKVVLGCIEPDPDLAMPLFERWHAAKIAERNARFASGAEAPAGAALYTGNVSLRRRDYLEVGGFDPAFGNSEDVELGLRLQKAGVAFEFSPEAVTLHASDHTSLSAWRARAAKYGAFDRRIAHKHPDLLRSNPWRFLFELNPVSRPLMAATVAAPALARPLGLVAYGAADALSRLGLERAALAGANLAFGLDYFRGLRQDAGSLPTSLRELASYSAQRLVARGKGHLLLRALDETRADQAAMRRYEQKYGHAAPSSGRLASDLVQKIGLQELAGYRLMRALRDAGLATAAKVVSRSMRHLYGSDIHWDAELAPGVMLVHGFGLAISHAAKVGPACILFQNVTLGMGTDPETRQTGAPTLQANVHVGPGATLIGPITVGAGSKIMAGVTLAHSVPAGSVVAAAEPEVRKRAEATPLAAAELRQAARGA
ncbi:MAG TPA: exopolysaccharide biosynthesis glycosyltransferase EpsD [Myxococcales bacterium]|jgi:serine acetyltransferase/GT2 family glycosyltransferase